MLSILSVSNNKLFLSWWWWRCCCCWRNQGLWTLSSIIAWLFDTSPAPGHTVYSHMHQETEHSIPAAYLCSALYVVIPILCNVVCNIHVYIHIITSIYVCITFSRAAFSFTQCVFDGWLRLFLVAVVLLLVCRIVMTHDALLPSCHNRSSPHHHCCPGAACRAYSLYNTHNLL